MPPGSKTQLSTEKLQRELSVLEEKRKAIQGVQRLKQKQVALIMQSVADVQASVEEVRLMKHFISLCGQKSSIFTNYRLELV